MLSEKPKSGLSETRKMTKSTMEKKRRARINDSLAELKTILAGMVTHKGERFDKMEKADILELTVKCVRQLQKQANSGECVHPSNLAEDNYRNGMNTCTREVIKLISSSNFSNTDPEVKTKLLDHLANNLSSSSQRYGVTSSKRQPNHQSLTINETSFDSLVDDERSRCPSTVSSDSNNNSQETDNNGFQPAFIQVQSPASPISPVGSPVFASYKPVPSVIEAQNIQSQTNMPTVPLTILVPANFCSSALGTTCVIPLNIQNTPPQASQATVLTGQTFTPNPYTSIAFSTTGSGVALVTSQCLTQNSNSIPQPSNSSFIAFTPPVIKPVHDVTPNIPESAFTTTVSEKLASPQSYQPTFQTNEYISNVSFRDKSDNIRERISTTPVWQSSSVNETVSSNENALEEFHRERRLERIPPIHVSSTPYIQGHSSIYSTHSLCGNIQTRSPNLNTCISNQTDTPILREVDSRGNEQGSVRNSYHFSNGSVGTGGSNRMWRPW